MVNEETCISLPGILRMSNFLHWQIVVSLEQNGKTLSELGGLKESYVTVDWNICCFESSWVGQGTLQQELWPFIWRNRSIWCAMIKSIPIPTSQMHVLPYSTYGPRGARYLLWYRRLYCLGLIDWDNWLRSLIKESMSFSWTFEKNVQKKVPEIVSSVLCWKEEEHVKLSKSQ